MGGSPVFEIVTVDRSDDGMLQAEAFDRLGDVAVIDKVRLYGPAR